MKFFKLLLFIDIELIDGVTFQFHNMDHIHSYFVILHQIFLNHLDALLSNTHHKSNADDNAFSIANIMFYHVYYHSFFYVLYHLQ